MSVVKITPEVVIAAHEASPQGFLEVNLADQRGSKKSVNKYHTVSLVLADGTKQNLGISWKKEPLKASLKESQDRKFGASIIFRKSSGSLGKAVVLIYDWLEAFVSTGLKKKTIKTRNKKWFNIVQTELENGDILDDPMIRFKLPFDFNNKNKQLFRLVHIKNIGGKNQPVDIKVNDLNLHEQFRSRSMTTGYVDMSSLVFSSNGISVPAKVQLIVVKPAPARIPDIADLMDEDDMADMVGDDDSEDDNADDEPVTNNPNAGEAPVDAEPDDVTETTEAELEALKNLNL